MRTSWFVVVVVSLMCLYATSLFAETADEWHAKGESAYKAKQYTKAIEYYSEALKLEPTRHATIYARGVNYFKSGKLAQAKADFDVVREVKGIDCRALNYLGLIYSKQGYDAAAMDMFRQAAEIQPDNPTYSLNTARFAMKTNHIDVAEAYYRKINNSEARDALKRIENKKAAIASAKSVQAYANDVAQFAAKYGFPPVYSHSAEALSDVFTHCSRKDISAHAAIRYLSMLGINHYTQSPGTILYVYYELPERPGYFYEVEITESGKVFAHHVSSKRFAQP